MTLQVRGPLRQVMLALGPISWEFKFNRRGKLTRRYVDRGVPRVLYRLCNCLSAFGSQRHRVATLQSMVRLRLPHADGRCQAFRVPGACAHAAWERV